MEHECTIGILRTNDDTDFITLRELKSHIKRGEEYNDFICRRMRPAPKTILRKIWYLRDYGDRRKTTDLHRFDYCPRCGKKIDWKAIRREDHG